MGVLFNIEGQWLGSLFFWGWDQIENTFWDYKPLIMSMFKKNWEAIPSDWRDNFFYCSIGKVWYYIILMTKKFKFSKKYMYMYSSLSKSNHCIVDSSYNGPHFKLSLHGLRWTRQNTTNNTARLWDCFNFK